MTDRGSIQATVWVSLLIAAACAGCMDGGADTMVTDAATVRQAAETTLYRAAASRNGALRAQAMESLADAQDPSAGEVLLRGLDDPDPEAVAVRFVAAMGIGDIAYAPATEKLGQMATSDTTNPNVRCGVIYALHRLGDNSHMSKLGPLLYNRSPEVRANAALVMGRIGLTAAIQPLNSRLTMEREPGVRLQLAESLASLGEQRSYGVLANYARIGEPHERLAAVQALGRTKSLRAKGTVLYAIGSHQPPPLRLVAAGSLAQMDDDRGFSLAVKAARDPKEFTQQSYKKKITVSAAQMQQMQSLAARALAEMDKRGSVDVLAGLLDNPNPTVRVSAARAILILLRRLAPETIDTVPEPGLVPTDTVPAPMAKPSDDAGEPVLRTAPIKD